MGTATALRLLRTGQLFPKGDDGRLVALLKRAVSRRTANYGPAKCRSSGRGKKPANQKRANSATLSAFDTTAIRIIAAAGITRISSFHCRSSLPTLRSKSHVAEKRGRREMHVPCETNGNRETWVGPAAVELR